MAKSAVTDYRRRKGGKEEPVYPARPKKRRPKGSGKRPSIGFRMPEDIAGYILEGVERGSDKTELAIEAIRTHIEAKRVMGDDWWDVERRAKVENVSIGVMLGRIVQAALKQPKKH